MLCRTLGTAALTIRMAKSYRHLFEQIYSFDNLYRSYLKARKGKRSRPEVQHFEQDLEGNLIQLQNELIWGQYRTGNYRLFKVYEPKERQVAALPFRDRVVQHALVGVIEPIWEARFINDSYACRPGRGTHAGADRVEAYLRRVKREHGQVYVFKADIAKYFQSIDHGILKALLWRYIKCRRTLDLINEIIDSSAKPGDARPTGLPIGNLTSQLCANVYLHCLDEFVKHELGERFYARYMDDTVIIHHDKVHLQQVRVEFEDFLWNRLRLKTNSKTQVFPVGSCRGRALDFLGYRIWPTHRKLRVGSIRRIKKTLRRLQSSYAKGFVTVARVRQSVTSWVGHACHAETSGLRRALLGRFVFTRNAVSSIDTTLRSTPARE
ncbi:MAG: reverse transcriptase/maturase family protein [Georgfuchsia sp.]